MRLKLGLWEEDLKAAMIKMFQQAITHMLETVKIIRNLIKQTEDIKGS